MDMEAARPALMGQIPHRYSFLHHSLPGHFITMAFQGHRMGNNLHAVIQASVMLDIDVVMVPVGDLLKLVGIIVGFTAHARCGYSTPRNSRPRHPQTDFQSANILFLNPLQSIVAQRFQRISS